MPSVKRSASEDSLEPHTPPPSSPTHPTPAVKGEGEWTPEKKEAIAQEIILAGIKAIDTTAVAAKYDLTRTQLANALTPGRSNLRLKLIKAARDC
ncbi:hypothetical protein BD324DRAFT_653493 [Kockovaella imperatae]|uniref:Uncharacterized protein n=1 Tax=Kockovaella imperatae TaxID=4999 RepID=A0A1Y1U9P1_9TREE|nr:hypothetical protein BD324DRAFT_653493 [Kockovaella imperatae]ORX34226.1 hypothetical protein BD324DRAFT_653493 [Kockovaella imperatae]